MSFSIVFVVAKVITLVFIILTIIEVFKAERYIKTLEELRRRKGP